MYGVGALVGAIIGSALGAAFITFVLTFMIVKRKSKKSRIDAQPVDRDGSQKPSTNRSLQMPEKSMLAADMSDFRWEAYLPQSADDQTVHSSVKTMFDQIELHVDNYYRRRNVVLDNDIRHGLSEIEPDAALPAPIDALMENPHVALAVIKHSIAAALIARISPMVDPYGSLLPSRLAESPTKLTESNLSSKETMGEQTPRCCQVEAC